MAVRIRSTTVSVSAAFAVLVGTVVAAPAPDWEAIAPEDDGAQLDAISANPCNRRSARLITSAIITGHRRAFR